MPQTPSNTGTQPAMHVPQTDSIKRRNWFKKKILPELNNDPGMGTDVENEFFYYNTQKFLSFLENHIVNSKSPYLRIYFGVNRHKLDLIYAIEENTHPKTEIYFFYNPKSGQFESLQKSTASAWVKDFIRIKVPFLVKCFPSVANPTKACKHPMSHIIEFIQEIKNRQPTGIKVYLSTYTDTDTIQHGYNNRMHVNFVFTTPDPVTGQETDTYVQDGKPADTAKKLMLQVASTNDGSAYNNATLCPPDNSCETDLTLP